MSECEIKIKVKFEDDAKASDFVTLVKSAKKHIESNSDTALHEYLQSINKTHDIEFDSWWIPTSINRRKSSVTLDMIGTPSGTIEQDIVTWIKKEGGKNISGGMSGEPGSQVLIPICCSNASKIAKNIELRERLYGPTMSGDIEELKALLAELDDIDSVEPWTGATSLMLASMNGHIGMVEYLLVNGADINWADKAKHATALTYAANRGHASIVQLLIRHGASSKYLTDEQRKAFGL